MATHYKAIVVVNKKSEHQLILWSDKDVLDETDSQILSDIMNTLQSQSEFLNTAVSFELKKIIECDSTGKTMIYDEYRIVDNKKLPYGFLEKSLGNSEWIYEVQNQRGTFSRTTFTGDKFQLYGVLTYQSQWFTQALPSLAQINWERLEVVCEGQVLELEVIAR